MSGILSLAWPQVVGLTLFCTLMAVAAVQDLVQMRISDLIGVALLACFALFPLPNSIGWSDAGLRIAVAIALFLAFALANYLGLMAGGDVKLIAATSVWFDPLLGTMTFLIATSLFGGAVALAHLIMRNTPIPNFFPKLAWSQEINSGKNRVPYGIGIAAGAVTAQLLILQ